MLAAVVLTAVVRSGPSLPVLLTALVVVIAAVLIGGTFRHDIRRHEGLQLASATIMAAAGVPIELAARMDLASVVSTALAWAVVFTASALNVRASFARVSRGRPAKAGMLQLGAVALPFVAAVLFALAGFAAQAVAAFVATAGSFVLTLMRPGIKRMKAVGLSLACIAALAFVALAFV